MTNDELVARLAEECERPQDVITDVLQALVDIIEGTLAKGEPAQIPGLGYFRTYPNNGTGRPVSIQWESDRALRARLMQALQVQRGPAPGAAPRVRGGSVAHALKRAGERRIPPSVRTPPPASGGGKGGGR